MFFKNTVVTLIAFLVIATAQGQDIRALSNQTVVIKSTPHEWLELNDQLEVFEEKRDLYIYEISSNAYKNQFLPYSIFGELSPESKYWGRISFWNGSGIDQRLILAVSNKYPINEVTVYYRINEGEFQRVDIGSASDQYTSNGFLGKRGNYLAITLPKRAYMECYIKIGNINGYDPSFNLAITEEASFRIEQNKENLLQGVFQGALWLIIIYQLLVFAFSRDKSRLFYSLYILSLSFYFLEFYSYTRYLPLLENFRLNATLVLFVIGSFSVWYIQFIRYFINLKKHLADWYSLIVRYAIVKFIITVIIAIAFSSSLMPFKSGVEILLAFVFLESLAIFVLLTRLVFLRLALGYFVVVGSSFLYASIIISSVTFYITDRQLTGNDYLQAGALIEILVFSLGLGYRIRVMQRRRSKLQSEKIFELQGTLTDNVHSIKTLEKQLQASQQQLEEKNSLVHRLLKEISEKEHSVNELDDLLAIQKEIIEQQTDQITLNAGYLEDIVQTRTTQLREINLQLVGQANQLEQFAYITSHKLRAPVATLIGLVSLLDKKHVFGDENKYIVGEVEKHTSILDEIIKDLNSILLLKRGIGQQVQTVFLNEATNEVINILDEQITHHQATIEYDFSEINNIRSIQSYIIGIFYNLISNAIKYRSADRLPVIQIKSFWRNDEVVICVTDNGIGIDLPRFKDRLFGLYQRFNLEVEGKGLGLYMTRVQTEALGGKIEVESQLEKGSTFSLYLRHTISRNAFATAQTNQANLTQKVE